MSLSICVSPAGGAVYKDHEDVRRAWNSGTIFYCAYGEISCSSELALGVKEVHFVFPPYMENFVETLHRRGDCVFVIDEVMGDQIRKENLAELNCENCSELDDESCAYCHDTNRD